MELLEEGMQDLEGREEQQQEDGKQDLEGGEEQLVGEEDPGPEHDPGDGGMELLEGGRQDQEGGEEQQQHSLANVGVGRILLGGRYDLNEGRVRCNCIKRKWKFCQEMKDLAGGRITPALLRTSSRGEVEEGRAREDRQSVLRRILEQNEGGREDGEASINLQIGRGDEMETKFTIAGNNAKLNLQTGQGDGRENKFIAEDTAEINLQIGRGDEWESKFTIAENNAKLNLQIGQGDENKFNIAENNANLNLQIGRGDKLNIADNNAKLPWQDPRDGIHTYCDTNKPLQNQVNLHKSPNKLRQNSTLIDFGFGTNLNETKLNTIEFGKIKKRRRKSDVKHTVQTNLTSFLSTGVMNRKILKAGRKLNTAC